MAAKKRKSTRRSASDSRMAPTLISFAIGVTVGVLTMTLLQQGEVKSDFGKGIRDFMNQSRKGDAVKKEETASPESENTPAEQKNIYDFYTVLPEVEVLIPQDYKEPETKAKPVKTDKTEVAKANDTSGTSAATDAPSSRESQSEQASSGGAHYVLQAGSYRREADAERFRARLALLGLGSYIQKVTIQDRGDFYRVRLGPFSNYEDMINADRTLGGEGIKPLRLKVSKSN